MKSTPVLFLTVLLVSFVVQLSYYSAVEFGDNDKWVQRVKNLSGDIFVTPIHIDFKDSSDEFRYGAHPGTTILLPAAFAYRLGADAQKSLINTIAFLNATLIAAITLTCYKLRPKSLWYITTGTILTIHPLYFYGTPTNIVIAPAIALLSLLALLIYENRKKPVVRKYIILFSIVFGFGLSTRLPITVVIATPLTFFIFRNTTLRYLLLSLSITGITSFVLNPFLWFSSVQYFQIITSRTLLHVGHSGVQFVTYSPIHFLYYSPITVIGLLVIGAVLLLPSYKPPVSYQFTLILLFITLVVAIIFSSSGYKTLRYLYPIIFIWDVFFPLFLLHAVKYFSFSYVHSSQGRARAATISRLVIAIIIILSFSYLTLYNFSFPGSQGII